MVKHGLVDAEAYRQANDDFYADYERGCLDIQAYLEFSLEPLTRYSLEELSEYHQQFMKEFIEPIRLPKAQALLEEHRAAGDYLLIITSTSCFITAPIGKALGVDHLLGTEPELLDQRYTGKIVGEPCFQDGKIRHLNQWLKNAEQYGFTGDIEGASFYSDSINDLPLLEMVDRPVVVDGDDQLLEIARERGWESLSLR